MHIVLETDRLILRPLSAADADALAALDADPRVMRYLFPDDAIGTEDLEHILAAYAGTPGYGFWAAIEQGSGAFLGWFLFRPEVGHPADEPELGYRLNPAAWGRGYATEGARALIHMGFTELGVRRVVASTDAANIGSWRVMEKLGMTRVGTKRVPIPGAAEGATCEDVLYVLERADWERHDTATVWAAPTDDVAGVS